ncbi:hypothetical protein AgCh_007099 [Apium graveolens]
MVSQAAGWGRSCGYEHHKVGGSPLLLAPMIIPNHPGAFSLLARIQAPFGRKRRRVSGRLGCVRVLPDPDRRNVLDPGHPDGGDVATCPGPFKQINCNLIMAEAFDQATSVCSHCDKIIPFSNIDLHNAHCSRNLVKCKICGDMVPGKLIEKHFLGTHATKSCSQCNDTIERKKIGEHKGKYCLQRIVKCDYCDFPLPAAGLSKHQEVCGSRTKLCYSCRIYVRLREIVNHESSCSGVLNVPAESSR